MYRDLLKKLFSEEKESFPEEMLFPEWIYKSGKEKNRVLSRAAVYIDIPIPCVGILEYEKEKSLLYCEQQEYSLITMIESIGCDNVIEKENWQRMVVLAGKGMVDVIVVSGLSRLSSCPREILQILDMLQIFQVQIDCIGYGILDYEVLKKYLVRTWHTQEQFERELDDYLCATCTREGI